MKKRPSKKFKQNLYKKKTVYKKSHKEKKKEIKSPRNYRIIPEMSLASLKKLFWNKYFLVSFISTFISVAIVMQGVDLTQHISQLREARQEREQVVTEIAYWEDVVASNKDYRDGYFKLALLEYQLGNREKARFYGEKAVTIDPNFKPAREFLEGMVEKED